MGDVTGVIGDREEVVTRVTTLVQTYEQWLSAIRMQAASLRHEAADAVDIGDRNAAISNMARARAIEDLQITMMERVIAEARRYHP